MRAEWSSSSSPSASLARSTASPYLERNGRRTPRRNLKLELVDTQGSVAQTIRSDFDGYFLFEGVLPDRYRIRVAEGAVKDPNVQTPELEIELPPEGGAVTGLELVLRVMDAGRADDRPERAGTARTDGAAPREKQLEPAPEIAPDPICTRLARILLQRRAWTPKGSKELSECARALREQGLDPAAHDIQGTESPDEASREEPLPPTAGASGADLESGTTPLASETQSTSGQMYDSLGGAFRPGTPVLPRASSREATAEQPLALVDEWHDRARRVLHARPGTRPRPSARARGPPVPGSPSTLFSVVCGKRALITVVSVLTLPTVTCASRVHASTMVRARATRSQLPVVTHTGYMAIDRFPGELSKGKARRGIERRCQRAGRGTEEGPGAG